MDLYEVMRTTFAAREFHPEPIPDRALHKILDNARFAPSGGNRQGWSVIGIRDSAIRAKLPGLMKPAASRYLAQRMAGEAPWNTIDATNLTKEEIAAAEAPTAFLEAIANAPTLLAVFVDLRVVASFDQDLERIGVISGGSVYPFIWNILLSARNEGYGGTMTTFITHEEADFQKLLGVPSHYAACALIPMGKPLKQLTKLTRKPVEEFAWIDRFNGDPIR
jgi:nitroreductase